MRRLIVVTGVLVVLLTACGDDGDGAGLFGGDDDGLPTVTGSAGERTADIDPCSLLTEGELTAVLGRAPIPEESAPAGPFTGCSWGTGDVLVSIATTDSAILAPGEEECPSADLGEESYACEGRVKFLLDGIQVGVSTIDPFLDDAVLLQLAQLVEPKIAG